MTSETLTAHNADAPGSSSTNRQRVRFGLTYTFLSIVSGNETPIRSNTIRVLYLIAISAPFVILITTAFRRRHFSVPLPAPWPQGAARLRRLNRLETAILITGLLCFAFSIIERLSFGRHDPRYTLPRDIFWFLTAWSWILTAYISDRRPLPPPREPRFTWAGMKPIQSDHWGQTAQQ